MGSIHVPRPATENRPGLRPLPPDPAFRGNGLQRVTEMDLRAAGRRPRARRTRARGVLANGRRELDGADAVQAGPHAASRIAPPAAPPRRRLFRRRPQVARDCLPLSKPAGWTHAVSLRAGLDHTSATIPWPQTAVRPPNQHTWAGRTRSTFHDGGQALRRPGPRKSPGPGGLQNRQGVVAPRLEGSIPSPLRSRDPARAVGSGLCAGLRGRAGRCRPGPHELCPEGFIPPPPPEALLVNYRVASSHQRGPRMRSSASGGW
jgi:hypothetical protein